MWSDHDVALFDRLGRGRSLSNRDLDRVFEMPLSDLTNGTGQGRGEERHLPIGWGLIQYPLNILGEPHSQHFVGFIQHQTAEFVQVQRAAPHVVHHPPRRSHNHVDTTIKLAELDVVVLPAKNRHDPKTAPSSRVFFE